MESKQQINYLIIGKTGAGKSTAINMIINQAHNIEYEGERKIAITQKVTVNEKDSILQNNIPQYSHLQSDDLNAGQDESQTKKPNIYKVQYKDYDLNLIDTPGINDNKGKDHDDKSIQNIINKIQEVKEIHAIIYVHRATDIREDSSIKYYIDRIKQMLTKDCEENIIVGFTSVVNSNRIDAKKILEKQGFNTQKSVHFENDCLIPSNLLKGIDEEELENYKLQSKRFWNKNKQQFDKMIDMGSKFKPQSSSSLLELQILRETLVKMTFEKIAEIKQQEKLKVQINQQKRQFQDILLKIQNFGSLEETMKEFVLVKKIIKVSVNKEIQLNQKITYCYGCQNKCHNPCYLDKIYSIGEYNIRGCAVFSNTDNCKTNCNHSYIYHGHTSNIRQETFQEQEITVVEEKINKVINQNKVAQKQQLEEKQKQMEQQIQKQEQQLKQINDNVEDSYKGIYYLYNQINEKAMVKVEEFHNQYLQEQIQVITQDDTISLDDKQNLINAYKNSMAQSKKIKEQLEKDQKNNNGVFTLDKDLLNKLQKQQDKVHSEISSEIKSEISKIKN